MCYTINCRSQLLSSTVDLEEHKEFSRLGLLSALTFPPQYNGKGDKIRHLASHPNICDP